MRNISKVLVLWMVFGLVSHTTLVRSQETAPPQAATPPYYASDGSPSEYGPAPGGQPEGPYPETPQLPGLNGTNDTGWPRVFVSGNVTNVVYQPQIDSWDGHRLQARSAVALETAQHPQPVYGAIILQATTLVDKSRRLVTLENSQIVSGEFPTAPDKGAADVEVLRREFPHNVQAISLDRLEASLAVTREQRKANIHPLQNTPPRIFISERPGILVSIDGQPAYRPEVDTELQRVINTRVLLLRDTPTGQYYLHVFDGYMQAPSLDGPWSVGQPPPGASIVENGARQSMQVDLLQGQPDPVSNILPSLSESTAPAIFVSTSPAELIAFNGPPQFVSIPGTQLLYASNTTGDVFKLQSGGQVYVLVSGRWFQGPSLSGPWQFVPGTQLPSDFARIPDDSPKENVKASVPATPQAAEALIANDIPQSTRIPTSAKMEALQFDGSPKLAPIEGTPLHYVVNSGTPVIEVNDNSWYSCQDGTWYTANSVYGPWSVASSVPPVIYSIPPSSPLHYVTYVSVYNATPDYVYEGYTPGYMGTEVAPDDTVVYGTGYDYAPWVGSYWYGPPITWGLGCNLAWTPWSGWCFGFGFGWGWDFGGLYVGWHPPAPWWGPFHHWAYHARGRMSAWGPGGWASTGANLYYRGRPRQGVAYHAFGGNEWRGVYGRSYNSRTGALSSGHYGRVGNIFHPSVAAQTTGRIGVSRANNAFATQPTGRTGVSRENNAFATPNNRVFLYNRGANENRWIEATPSPSRVAPEAPPSNFGRENEARDFGQQRFEGFQGSYPSGGFHGGGGFGGGGFHGGGGGGGAHGGGGGGGHR